MISVGIHIGWLAVRATILALVAWAAACGVSRRDARSSAVVLAGAVAMLLGIWLAALCPFPTAFHWSPFGARAGNPGPSAVADASARPSNVAPDHGGITLAQVRVWLANLGHVALESPGLQRGWSVLALCYCVGVTLAGLRVFFGWWAVRRLRRESRPLADLAMLESAESLRVALGCRTAVELRVCNEPGLAATVGWRRPVIFLPPEWPGWSVAQRRAVLAHELAHVRHRDFVVGLLTCLCRAVYFYHPLVRRLSARLRWQQEVAADALAATAAGGRDVYVKSLARLALGAPARTPAQDLAWSAFSGTTLVRRIRMLQGTENRKPLARGARAALLGLFAATALLITTAAMPESSPGSEERAAQVEPAQLGYLAPNTKAVLAVRPALWFKQPGMDKFSKMIDDGLQTLKALGITWPADLRPENVDQVVMDMRISSQGTGKPGSRSLTMGSSAILVRMNKDMDWTATLKDLAGQLKTITRFFGDDVAKKMNDVVKETRRDGVSIYRLELIPMFGPQAVHFYAPDKRTVLFCILPARDDDSSFRKLIAEAASARRRDWGADWKQVERAPLAMVLDNRDGHYRKLFAKDLGAQDLAVLENVRFATLGIELGEGRPVRVAVEAKSPAGALEVEKAMNGYARALLAELDNQEVPVPANEAIFVKLGNELLQSRRLKRTGPHLEWQGFSSVRVPQLIGAYVEAYGAATSASESKD
jgi:hypothetical protein